MNSRSQRQNAARGFTLLEVLIALAIVAMSAGALMGTITSSASNISYLKDKTLAEWVALNRLTEIRIAQQMPDKGKRTGNAEMGGMRWQWEQEVTEMPLVEGLFRVDVRARPTGESVDDSREPDKSDAQTETKSEASGSETEKLAWTTTVTGFVGSARSERREPIAAPLHGSAGREASNNQGGGGNHGNPATPGAPGMPGTPGMPGAPGGDPKPTPTPDR